MLRIYRFAGFLPALALSTACLAQASTDTTSPPAKTVTPDTHVQVTSDTGAKKHCRDTDTKTADGTMPAQTSTDDRLEKSQAECRKTPAKIKAPDSKDELKDDSGDRSSVPSNDKG